jgi:hypothetical protein
MGKTLKNRQIQLGFPDFPQSSTGPSTGKNIRPHFCFTPGFAGMEELSAQAHGGAPQECLGR